MVTKTYTLNNSQKRQVTKDICNLGRDINKIYLKLDKKYSLPIEYKDDFSDLSLKLSKLHALITKCITRKP